METLLIRKATLNDAVPLAAVMAAAYAPFAQTIRDLPDVTSGLDGDIADHNVWVALTDQTLVGGLVAMQIPTGLHIVNVAVHPSAGGQGIGQRLMQAAETFGVSAGLKTFTLATHPNMPKNVRFYQKLGWSVTKTSAHKIEMKKRL